ncbi:MAG TPA: DUF6166 domain-containing protein [Terriglobales bacterium]|nr:DUF6166 domain-containing protein [Terriglobales bacterium]
MVVNDSLHFKQAAQELLPHVGHKLNIIWEGGDAAQETVGVVCEDCQAVLLDFAPESATAERPDQDRVKYEGHYDVGRDVCYVEVFKPGKSPYPLQERQDIVNHSPTGIAWGYGGSGPAQCAFAILMDYFEDEERARALYQQFKFAVIARFAPNSDWTLNGRQVEHAIARIAANLQA